MKAIIFVLGLLLFIPNKVEAQAHPCDGAPQPNPSLSSPAKVGFCFNMKNTDGSDVKPITNFKVYVGTSTTPVWTGLVPAVGSPSDTGVNYFETPPINFSAGSLSVRVTVTTADGEGAASPAFPFTVIVVRPGAPSIIRIVK